MSKDESSDIHVGESIIRSSDYENCLVLKLI